MVKHVPLLIQLLIDNVTVKKLSSEDQAKIPDRYSILNSTALIAALAADIQGRLIHPIITAYP
jgi:hypothetical protein